MQESFEGNQIRSGEYNSHQVGENQFQSLCKIHINIQENFQEEEYCGEYSCEQHSVEIRLSQSSYDASCSVLSHLYLECGIGKEKASKDLWTQISLYKKSTRKMAIKERKHLGLATTEGKNPLPLRAYKYLENSLQE